MFGLLQPECDARDSFVLHGLCADTAGAHRDCPLSFDIWQLQFIAVLQGTLELTIERRVFVKKSSKIVKKRLAPTPVKANQVLFCCYYH